jgi:hypothetical protein
MREGRPVKGGAQQTRELLKRNTALNEELDGAAGHKKSLTWSGVLRQRGQAMPDENNGKVPKEALLRYLAEDGAVRFEEVTLRESGTKRNLANEEQLGRLGYSSEVSEDGLVMAFMDLNDPGDMMSAAEMRQFGLPAEAVRLADTIERSFYGSKGSARYGSYQLPGGENYREVVLAMPRQDGGQSMFNVYGPEDRYVKQFKTRADAEAEVAQNGGRIKELFLKLRTNKTTPQPTSTPPTTLPTCASTSVWTPRASRGCSLRSCSRIGISRAGERLQGRCQLSAMRCRLNNEATAKRRSAGRIE